MTIIIKQMRENAVSLIQGWRGIKIGSVLFDLYNSYSSGIFHEEKKFEVELKY